VESDQGRDRLMSIWVGDDVVTYSAVCGPLGWIVVKSVAEGADRLGNGGSSEHGALILRTRGQSLEFFLRSATCL
jgi:hypothetical protein